MTKIRYSKDMDAILIELADAPIDYAEEKGQLIVHFSKTGEPVLLEILDARVVFRHFQPVFGLRLQLPSANMITLSGDNLHASVSCPA